MESETVKQTNEAGIIEGIDKVAAILIGFPAGSRGLITTLATEKAGRTRNRGAGRKAARKPAATKTKRSYVTKGTKATKPTVVTDPTEGM